MVSQLHLQLWHRASPERRRILLERGMAEQLELQRAVSVSHNLLSGELAGRTTGSAEWRRARGEMGDESKTQAAIRAQEDSKQQMQQQRTAEAEERKDKTTAAAAVAPLAAAPAVSASSSASSGLPSAAQAPAPSPAVDSVEEGKRQGKLLFSRYYSQLTAGCGRSDCRNEYCRSSPSFVPGTDSSAAAIAKRCLELTARYKAGKLCDTVNAGLSSTGSS